MLDLKKAGKKVDKLIKKITKDDFEKFMEMDKKRAKAMEFVHPELKKGETFLINILPKEVEHWANIKNHLKWVKSIRIGKVAYKTGGKELSEGYLPVFAVLKPLKKRK